jgi:hypothetical protein
MHRSGQTERVSKFGAAHFAAQSTRREKVIADRTATKEFAMLIHLLQSCVNCSLQQAEELERRRDEKG